MKYRIRWNMSGTTFVDADTDTEAENKFDELEPSELVNDWVSMDTYDVEECEDDSK